MLTKLLVAVIALMAGWMLVRYLSQPRRQTPAKADAPKAAADNKVTTLERDPKTGIYR